MRRAGCLNNRRKLQPVGGLGIDGVFDQTRICICGHTSSSRPSTSFPLWFSHPKRKLYPFFSMVQLYNTKLKQLFYLNQRTSRRRSLGRRTRAPQEAGPHCSAPRPSSTCCSNETARRRAALSRPRATPTEVRTHSAHKSLTKP